MRLFSKHRIHPVDLCESGGLTDVWTVKASPASGRLQTGHLGRSCVMKELT